MGQMSFAKAIVVIDDKELLSNGKTLLKHILNTVDFSTDIIITEGILDVLDHSAPQPFYGSKMGLDATLRFVSERPRSVQKPRNAMNDTELFNMIKKSESGFIAVRRIFPECTHPLILIAVEKKNGKNSKYFIQRLPEEALAQGICVLYDAHIDLADDSLVLWKAFNNVDPARDIRITATGVIIDATKKTPADGHMRPWPDEIEMTAEIKERVNKLNGIARLQGPSEGN
jgi:4-hydroxy-3-polyprenylbenzoate decarboxylase